MVRYSSKGRRMEVEVRDVGMACFVTSTGMEMRMRKSEIRGLLFSIRLV